ncbi:protein of unknown function [Shewanella benthica]|uniref:Uncharacterized protein n=1 Tax=Shewanella benthica TaxID=43661 RepID=A0A330LZY4_9GAMM|nr:protein of unknown function [Shewanella benthica]
MSLLTLILSIMTLYKLLSRFYTEITLGTSMKAAVEAQKVLLVLK